MSIGRHGVDPEVVAEVLSDEPNLIPFVTAVINHLLALGAASNSAENVVERVFAAVGWGDSDVESVRFDQDPELLASFFQNADLLDPNSESTPRISKDVLAALQRLTNQDL